jgi:hypothetical protein
MLPAHGAQYPLSLWKEVLELLGWAFDGNDNRLVTDL